MSLIISPNVKRIYNNHFKKILNYTPDSILEHHDVLDEKVIIINIQNKDLQYKNLSSKEKDIYNKLKNEKEKGKNR